MAVGAGLLFNLYISLSKAEELRKVGVHEKS